MSTHEFVMKAKKIHNNAYDYRYSIFKGAHEKVNIFCLKHNDLFSQRASSHLEGRECPQCAKEKRVKQLEYFQHINSSQRRKDKETFINQAVLTHGVFYDYNQVNYKNCHTKVSILCPKHGEFKQTPNKHLNGNGCPECKKFKTSSTKQKIFSTTFIEKSKQIHGDFYNYSNVRYVKAHEHITIICPKHGEFKQTPNSHLNGSGCPRCSNIGFLNETFFKNNPEYIKKQCLLYLIEIQDKSEQFMKVGITTQPLTNRIKEIKKLYENVQVINYLKISLFKAFTLEQFFLSVFRTWNIQYNPEIKFCGHTECFYCIDGMTKWISECFTSIEKQTT